MEKVTLFLMVILGGVIAGVLLVNPEGMKQKKGGSAPMFEFRSYAYYDITENGVGEFLLADEGYHYENLDLLTGVNYFFKTDGGIDTLQGHTAYIYRNYTDFNGSVRYEQSSGYKLESRDVRYNKEKSTITGERPFILSAEDGEFRGERFRVDTEKKIFKAEQIKSWFLLDQNRSSKVTQ